MNKKDFFGRTRDEKIEEDSERARYASEEIREDVFHLRKNLSRINWMLVFIMILVIILLIKAW